jgi:hypothetical protein
VPIGLTALAWCSPEPSKDGVKVLFHDFRNIDGNLPLVTAVDLPRKVIGEVADAFEPSEKRVARTFAHSDRLLEPSKRIGLRTNTLGWPREYDTESKRIIVFANALGASPMAALQLADPNAVALSRVPHRDRS